MRRARDLWALPSTVAGFLVIGLAVGLRVYGITGESGMLVLAVLGGILVRGESIIDAVRAWRRTP